MKAIALTLLALAACSFTNLPGGKISAKDASQAVYKIKASIELQQIEPRPGGEPELDAFRDSLFLNKEFSSEGPILMDAVRLDDGVIKTGWSGTGWVADRLKGGRSYMMTAGHVCETRDFIEEDSEDFFTGQVVHYKFAVLSVKYKFIGADNTEYEGAKALVDDDQVDLCVLTIGEDLGDPIPFASGDPKYGQDGFYIGAPKGIWGGGIAGIYRTMFMGRGDTFKGNCGKDMPFCDRDELTFSSAEAAPGASGSPIIYDGQAVAVLNMGPRSFSTFTQGVPWQDMRKALTKAKHEATE